MAEREPRAEEIDVDADATTRFPDDRLRLIFTCCHPRSRPSRGSR